MLSRRKFIGAAASTLAGFTIVPRHVLGGPGFVPPSEKVNIAIIGCGGQGRTNIRSLFEQPDAQIIAIADPVEYQNLDPFYYKGAAGRLPIQAEIEKHFATKTSNYKIAAYEDFRLLLEKEKAGDAILCATPDHLHACVSATAMRMKKHVYCEKPLTHNVWEAPGRADRQRMWCGHADGQRALRRFHPRNLRANLGWSHRQRSRSPRLDQRHPLE